MEFQEKIKLLTVRNQRQKLMFKRDLLEELNITGHEKADMIFDMAWETSILEGLEEVYHTALDLKADLL